MLRNCVDDFKDGNYTVREKLKRVVNTFYNGTEISAQEAAFCRLRLPMSYCSVVVEFINTGLIKTRHRMLKSKEELSLLDPESNDVEKNGAIERYADRPDAMESVCLADFVALYNYTANNSRADEVISEVNDQNDDAIGVSTSKIKLRTLKGFLTKRKLPKVIRFCRFDGKKEPTNFFRELVMLFKPWRKEVEEVESQNCEEIYKLNKDAIEAKYREYTLVDLNFNDIIKELEDRRRLEDQELLQRVDNNDDVDETMIIHDYDDNLIQANVLIDMGEEIAAGVKTFSIPEQISDDKYFELCDDLNTKQREYLMSLVNAFKMNEVPIHHFITGGAGVGKSRLIRSIYQSILRIFRQWTIGILR